MPIGVPGELYVGGAGVARGYLRRPELTAERFVPDPFSRRRARRLYRTGDLARRLENGDLEYLGRIDDQVKIRGFRIELGEIEAVLRQHPDVTECRRHRARRQRPGQAPGRLHRRRRKPRHARRRAQDPPQAPPARIHGARPLRAARRLPLTPNGKVDRKALPAPDPEAPRRQARHVAPRTPTETRIAAIWADVLGIASPGVQDNFFDLGGHSLKAAQIVAALRSTFGVDAAMRHLFEQPTIAGLADIVDVLAVSASVAGVG